MKRIGTLTRQDHERGVMRLGPRNPGAERNKEMMADLISTPSATAAPAAPEE